MPSSYKTALLHLSIKLLANFPSQRFRKFVLRLLGAQIDSTAVLYGGFEIRSPRKLKIGAGSCIGHRATLDARGGLTIGKNVNFSSEVMIWTAQHDWRDPMFGTVFKPVVIGDFAWLGPRCIILPGGHGRRGFRYCCWRSCDERYRPLHRRRWRSCSENR
jgi:acetyltransferase-like isoleucine patch superfamily enzyme